MSKPNESRIVGYRGRKGTKYSGSLHAPLLEHVTPDGRCVYASVDCYDPIDAKGDIVPCDVDENGNWVERVK